MQHKTSQMPLVYEIRLQLAESPMEIRFEENILQWC